MLRGSVRIVAGLGTRTRRWEGYKLAGKATNSLGRLQIGWEGYELAPTHVSAWRTRRAGLKQRRSARSLRYRFRRDPAAYLAQLKALLLKHALPP